MEDNKNYDVFEKYTKVDVAFDQGYSGMRCYLNEDESFGGAYFRYTFEYETNDENLVDSSIEVYITAEPLEKFEGLLPTIEGQWHTYSPDVQTGWKRLMKGMYIVYMITFSIIWKMMII